jgi:hypothetical protein
MGFSSKTCSIAVAASLGLVLSFPFSLRAGDPVENAGVGIGVTAGNMLFVPSKAISLVSGLTAGALSFLLTGGDVEVTRQAWQNTLQGPYVITPSIARTAIGERPELEKK